jgi:hypothetical protein
MRTTGYQRTRARVVRAGDVTSYLSIEAWCGGQVAVRVSTASLISATGLSRDQLPGTELTVGANLTATADTGVNPGDFRLNAPAPDGQPSHTSALPAAARGQPLEEGRSPRPRDDVSTRGASPHTRWDVSVRVLNV